MSDARSPREAYDRVAHLYDVDMAASMRFADVDFYARIARECRGRVLELGCGNGRILLELLARGVDAVGADASAAMLAELARKAGERALGAPACRMDARALGFAAGAFAAVLCPYSLVTYMTTPGDLAKLTGEAWRVLARGGIVVLDAFVPREGVESDAFRHDYERRLGERTLRRMKRIRRVSASVNRIERRYEIVGEEGGAVETIDTVEEIRAFAPAELDAALRDAGFSRESQWWDYGAAVGAGDAQFYTVAGRRD